MLEQGIGRLNVKSIRPIFSLPLVQLNWLSFKTCNVLPTNTMQPQTRDIHTCPIHVVRFMLISNLISDLISDFGTASMLNYTIRSLITNFGIASILIIPQILLPKSRFMVWFNMEAIGKSDIKPDIRFGNRFDIRIKQTTWIGHKGT